MELTHGQIKKIDIEGYHSIKMVKYDFNSEKLNKYILNYISDWSYGVYGSLLITEKAEGWTHEDN